MNFKLGISFLVASILAITIEGSFLKLFAKRSQVERSCRQNLHQGASDFSELIAKKESHDVVLTEFNENFFS